MLNLNLQLFAHKKGVGSTKNGRDSEAKRLGAFPSRPLSGPIGTGGPGGAEVGAGPRPPTTHGGACGSGNAPLGC